MVGRACKLGAAYRPRRRLPAFPVLHCHHRVAHITGRHSLAQSNTHAIRIATCRAHPRRMGPVSLRPCSSAVEPNTHTTRIQISACAVSSITLPVTLSCTSTVCKQLLRRCDPHFSPSISCLSSLVLTFALEGLHYYTLSSRPLNEVKLMCFPPPTHALCMPSCCQDKPSYSRIYPNTLLCSLPVSVFGR